MMVKYTEKHSSSTQNLSWTFKVKQTELKVVPPKIQLSGGVSIFEAPAFTALLSPFWVFNPTPPDFISAQYCKPFGS